MTAGCGRVALMQWFRGIAARPRDSSGHVRGVGLAEAAGLSDHLGVVLSCCLLLGPRRDVGLEGCRELVGEDLLDLELKRVELECVVQSVRAVLGGEVRNPGARVQQVLQPTTPLDPVDRDHGSCLGTLLGCGHLALLGRLVPGPAQLPTVARSAVAGAHRAPSRPRGPTQPCGVIGRARSLRTCHACPDKAPGSWPAT
jgi:hypothetical protein